MTLSWRLLRFLRANEVELTEAGAGAAPLVPRTAGGDEGPSEAALLVGAAHRATHVAGAGGIRALAQPRGAVEVLRGDKRWVLDAHERTVVGVGVVGEAVLTLGVDDAFSSLKVWKVADAMQCTSTLRFAPDEVATALAVCSRGGATRLVAAGCADGAVTIFSGDMLRERVQRKRVAAAAGEMSTSKPVVFVAFADQETIFVVTEASIAVVDVSTERRTVLDTRGASRGELCTITSPLSHLCVAREEALYFFTKEGRGPCLAFATRADGCVNAVGRYILHGVGGGDIVAYDVANKVLAYRGRGDVRCLFEDDDDASLLCMKDGTLRRLVEVPLADRVTMLLDRELFVPAVALARSESTDAERKLLMRAIRRYAGHLIEKGAFDAAAEQLVDTIGGGVEPSWVITRLVEQPGLRSGLRLYLEKLHAAGRAAFVHTKVLITCYRHDRARAAVLPKCDEASATVDDAHVAGVLENVDWKEREVDSAISMCRAGGLSRVAESLARGRGRHVALAEVLVDDLEDFGGALTLLGSMQEDGQVVRILRVVARRLLVKIPGPFVDFLSNAICKSSVRAASTSSTPRVQLGDFSALFYDRPRWHAVLLERVLARPGGLPAVDVPAAWLELFEALVCVDVAERAASGLSPSDPKIQPADAPASELDERRSTHSTHTDYLTPRKGTKRVGRRALKILQSRRSMIDLRKALRIAEVHGHDTCLEYLYEYLRMYRELGTCLRENDNGKALLRAARRHGEREPQLWLEALRLFAPRACDELLALEEAQCSSDKFLDDFVGRTLPRSNTLDLDSLGSMRSSSFDHPQMLTKHKTVFDDSVVTSRRANMVGSHHQASEALNEVMNALERSGVLSPLEIVDVVTECAPNAPWTILADFLEQTVTTMNQKTQQVEFDGMRLGMELQKLRKEAVQLGEEAVIMRPQPCAACDEPSAVPMMHFFCGCSYHASCLAPASNVGRPGDSAGSLGEGMWVEECPKCAPQQDAAVNMREAIEERNVKHDEFYSILKSSRDGFATVVEYLERSPFI